MRPNTISMTIAALAVVAVPHAGAADSQTEVVTPSEIVSNPDKFDGKHVRVNGYVVITPHSRNIYDSKQGYTAKGNCLGLYGSKSFVTPLRKRMEIVQGVFKKVLCGPDDICLYWCSSSGIELDD